MIPISTVLVTILPDGRMDRKNAARYCGFSEKTLAMHACRGTGPDFVKRGKVFYFREDVDRWIREGKFGKRRSEDSSGPLDLERTGGQSGNVAATVDGERDPRISLMGSRVQDRISQHIQKPDHTNLFPGGSACAPGLT